VLGGIFFRFHQIFQFLGVPVQQFELLPLRKEGGAEHGSKL